MRSKIKKPNNNESSGADEKIFLCNCVFGDKYIKELKEINKHEIITKIAECLGSSPYELSRAETIFNRMKYVIANYIIHHEYNSSKGISIDLLAWLDSHTNPGKSRKLNKFISRFLK